VMQLYCGHGYVDGANCHTCQCDRELRAEGAAAERAKIVAWLREQAQARAYGYARSPEGARALDRAADAIERGEHET
jgi:hypothetical protein